MTGNEGPSLRGGEAAEAIQAGDAAPDGREACRVAAPLLDCFALASLALAMTENAPSLAPAMTGMRRRFAPARNDGEPLARQRGGIWSSSAI
jgi:hypothetical protein